LTSDGVPTGSNGGNVLSAYKWTLLCVALMTPAIYRVLYFFLVKDQPPKGLQLVPGPGSTIPYIGRVDIDAIAPWNSMKNWSDKFNGLFRLQACGEMHIWLGDSDVAQELYCKRAAIYSSRPEVAAVPGSDSQGQYLPLLEYGGECVRPSMHDLADRSRPLANATQVCPHCIDHILQQRILRHHQP
jgi:hypothetical protein